MEEALKMLATSNPATKLEGLQLPGGWKVGALEKKAAGATGGNFSQTYKVANSRGQTAFLEALDYQAAFSTGGDFTRVVQTVTEHFNYERDMLTFCEQRGMDRVVKAIDSGTVTVDPSPLGNVPYLIFEIADRDVRAQIDHPDHRDCVAWRLRTLHHIAVGLKQLHSADVAHQDVKPSNIFVFRADQANRISKIGDLGRVSRMGTHSPFDVLEWPGDRHYAPPEIQYSFILPDFYSRRVGSDLYLLGSMISFLFTRTTSIACLINNLAVEFWPGNWTGTFDEVLPYLADAFAVASNEFSEQLPLALRSDLVPLFRYLCEPDPRKRGYPGSPVSRIALEKVVTRFDVMARKAAIGKYGKP